MASLYPTYSCCTMTGSDRRQAAHTHGTREPAVCESCPHRSHSAEHGTRVARPFGARRLADACDPTYVARTRRANELRFGCPSRPKTQTRIARPLGARPDDRHQGHAHGENVVVDHVGAFPYRPRSQNHTWNAERPGTWPHQTHRLYTGRWTRQRGRRGSHPGHKSSLRRPAR